MIAYRNFLLSEFPGSKAFNLYKGTEYYFYAIFTGEFEIWRFFRFRTRLRN